MCDHESGGTTLYKKMFVWNEFLTRGIRHNLRNTVWTVALVYGFFKQVRIVCFPPAPHYQRRKFSRIKYKYSFLFSAISLYINFDILAVLFQIQLWYTSIFILRYLDSFTVLFRFMGAETGLCYACRHHFPRLEGISNSLLLLGDPAIMLEQGIRFHHFLVSCSLVNMNVRTSNKAHIVNQIHAQAWFSICLYIGCFPTFYLLQLVVVIILFFF